MSIAAKSNRIRNLLSAGQFETVKDTESHGGILYANDETKTVIFSKEKYGVSVPNVICQYAILAFLYEKGNFTILKSRYETHRRVPVELSKELDIDTYLEKDGSISVSKEDQIILALKGIL